MKHICLFSGGSASSYVGWLLSQRYKKEDIILLHTPTYAEHPDADRFRKQVSEYIGIEITVREYGLSLWELINKQNTLPSQFIPFCTRILKQEQSEKFYKELSEKGEDFTIYVGFGRDEWRRIQRQQARFESLGYKSRYLLWEEKVTGEYIREQIRDVWRICLPEPYKWLEHNNCIPCFKGGKKHFYKVWKYYPEYFNLAVERERVIGHTVFKDKRLEELVEDWKKMDKGKESQMTFGEWGDEGEDIPCLCAL